MEMASHTKRRSARQSLACLLMLGAAPAFAAIDTFTVRHVSGPCDEARFGTGHFLWDSRKRIQIGSGERVSIRLHGHYADWAQDVSGANIFEWIESKGTTDDYPGSGGNRKGYVDVHVRAAGEHGTGNRTVTVKWASGSETIDLKIVASCAALADAPYRTTVQSQTSTVDPGAIGRTRLVVRSSLPNLLPAVQNPYVLARAHGSVVATTSGGMWPVNTDFCANLPPNVVSTVEVPPLRWGVSGANITATTAPFTVQLFNDADPAAPVPLDTLTLTGGMAPTSPLVQRVNYAGRPATLRVVRDPRFRYGESITQTVLGCFTAPGVTQPMEPAALRIVVDTTGAVGEGEFEADNALRLQ